MKKFFLATTALFALAGGAAVAADMPVKAIYKTPPPVYTWTGCYVGAGWGYRMYNREHYDIINATGFADTTSATSGSRGWLATAQVGCDYQVSERWVIGAFVDGDLSSIKGDYQSNRAFIQGSMKERSSWAVGGRIGYVVMPELLTFVSGGWTQARWDGINFATSQVAAGVTDTLPARTWGGWFVGAGTEYAIGFLPGLFWKNEYRFASFGSHTDAYLTPTITAGLSDRSQLYSHTIRSELVWRFGGSAVVARY